MTPAEARSKLDALLTAAEPTFSTQSSTKYADLKKFLAEDLGVAIGALHIKYIGGNADVGNRLNEGWKPDKRVFVGILGFSGEDPESSLPRYVAAASGVVAAGRYDAVLLAGKHPDGAKPYSPITVVAQPAANLGKKLCATFGAELSPVERTTQSKMTQAADVTALAEELLVDREWLEEVLWLFEDKKAVVLYGPPGTGKTWIARKIAAFVQPDDAKRRLVQLHPTYAYEDFFEGYRPVPEGSGIALALRPGPLRELATTASTTDEPVVLIMDEMNRGNLPRVFGELFFLLEYRSERLRLMYSPDEEFSLPKDLRFLGTMNTADRSIAVLDQALRRRFHFVGVFPDAAPVKELLRRFLAKHHPDLVWVADVLDEANRQLDDRHAAIGPSHFLRMELTDDIVQRIWRASVLPTIEERFWNQKSRLASFDLDALREAVKRRAAG